jgi:hypothetical protein
MDTTHTLVRPQSPTTLAPTAPAQAGPAGRLVVVVPSVGEAGLLASRIHEVARDRGLDVVLIGMAADYASEAELRRKLALLAAFMRDAGTQVEMRLEGGLDGLRSLRFVLSDRDHVACCVDASQRGPRPSWAESLASQLQRPVYVFEEAGYADSPNTGLIARLAPWFGSLAIIAGFLWLQLQVSQQGTNLMDTALLVLTVPVEIALIWLCNSIFA